MKTLVIIVSYNFESWIDRCLGSLRLSEYPVDTIVIDNASQDRTVQRIKKDYPEIRLIESGTNLGFGRANNIGLQIALAEGYTHAFLLNQDAWIEPDTIGTLTALSEQHPSYGILSPTHLTGKGDKPDPGFGHYAQIKDRSQLPKEELLTLPFVNAAFWMIPVNVLKKVGGFCPLFYHYGEDVDFVNRLHYHHYLLGYSPKVFGYHDREYRPETYERFLRSEFVYHLSEYANVNYSWAKAFGYGVLAVVKKAMTSLLSGKLPLSKDYLKIGFRLLSQSHEVHTYRKTNRLSHPHYIEKQ